MGPLETVSKPVRRGVLVEVIVKSRHWSCMRLLGSKNLGLHPHTVRRVSIFQAACIALSTEAPDGEPRNVQSKDTERNQNGKNNNEEALGSVGSPRDSNCMHAWVLGLLISLQQSLLV